MGLSNASKLSDFGSGIGTQGAVLQVDSVNQRVGIGTTNPQATLQVGTGVTVYGNTGIVSATSFRGDGSALTGIAAGYWEKTNAGINTSSKVGIGTTNPIGGRLVIGGATVTAAGGLRVTDSDSGFNTGVEGALVDYDGTAARYGHINGASGSAKPIQFMVGSAEKSKIDTAGNLFVGTANSSFLKPNGGGVGVGTLSISVRNSGVGTAVGTIVFNVDADGGKGQLEVYTGPSGWVGLASESPAVPFSATGGTKIPSATTGNGFTYHIFTTGPDSFIAPAPGTVDILVVGGGGGGGRQHGGGGGGGSVVHATSQPITSGSFTVTIGSAGAAGSPAGPYADTPGGNAGNGGTSTFGPGTPLSISALGGGGGSGAAGSPTAGLTGGSGGGSANGNSGGTAATAPPTSPSSAATTAAGGKSFQNAGGPNPSGNTGSGGGGAGSAGGAPGAPNTAGPGGAGQPFPAFPGPLFTPMPAPWQSAVGPTGLFGGGGGGAGHSNPGPIGGNPGPGGGGSGGSFVASPEAASGTGNPGVNNTGGGGGAGGSNDVGASTGGTGVVIVRYAD